MSEDQASVSNETDIKGKATMKRSSDTRKEQNRVSSRNYREKRRQKLALLEQILKAEDDPEQSLRETASSDGGGSNAEGNVWDHHSVPEISNTFTQMSQNLSEPAPDWTAWAPPSNIANFHSDMVLMNVPSDQDWSSYLRDSNVPVPNAFAVVPSVAPTAVDPPSWQNTGDPAGEASTSTHPSRYAAVQSTIEPGATSVDTSPEQAMGCIIKRIGNLTPSQKRALINLLQQDTCSPEAADSIHMSKHGNFTQDSFSHL
ncbi:hypothetical protein NLU13_3217 [Sarocladium strictum]|uniref:BZIP domain-containing protein n=1 Tax=Sarocladium strictum TaxID=5046 RepID=A0AA39LA17_SARSR|nr:hypothetical protein NLU13_3217 [Sarocladium strictum]